MSPRKWSAGFDGRLHFSWEQPHDIFKFAEQQAHEGIPLPEFFWSSHGAGFPDSLTKHPWQVKSQEVVGGYRCYVLSRKASYDTYQARYELTISPLQSFLPVRYKVFANGKLSWSYELLNLEKSKIGLWFPRRVRKVDTYMKRTFDARIVRYEPDYEFDEEYFKVEVPPGVRVRDHRVGHVYINDPWWPDIKPILRNVFNWPPVDLTPLRDVASYADAAIKGKPAPPLRVAKWIHGTPVDLQKRRGKVTLLYFSSGSLWSPNPKWVAALKGLYETYRPFGFEVVGINTSTEDVEQAEQNLRELRIPWPVAVDTTAKDSPHGQTFKAYKLKTYVSPILVDHEGKVHLIERGKIVDGVKSLLEAAGADDVPTMSLEFVRQPNDISALITKTWRQWIRKAPTTAKITGKMTDAHGPLPLVLVQASLRLEMTSSANTTLATSVINFRDRNFRCKSAEDGTYELPGLCKGTYMVTFKLPGQASVERRIVVPSHTSTVSTDVKLDQGDGVRGRVVDESGRAISGARVKIRHRHFDLKCPHRYTTYNRPPSVSDNKGRFRFDKLQSGAYTLDVTHNGYEQGTAAQVPAGTHNTVVTLKQISQ